MSDTNVNGLSPAELERLALLVEEMAEAQHVIGKILRHGYESRHPNGGLSNRGLLEHEMGDVSFALSFMCELGDMMPSRIEAFRDKKSRDVWQYFHHQGGEEVMSAQFDSRMARDAGYAALLNELKTENAALRAEKKAAAAEVKRLRDMEKHSREVMWLLEKHGASIVPHLLDTDENAGQRLREALEEYGNE